MKNSFKIALLSAILISFVFCSIIASKSLFFLQLNENQLLYLFSMKGQIIGGVFALTLTAYIFFADKLREIGVSNEDYYEATLELRKKYFGDLSAISIVVIFSILFCILGILMLSSGSFLYTYIINQSIHFFVISFVSILVFGVSLLNPKKIDNEVRSLGKKIENKYPVTKEDERATMEDFIKSYNSLEKTIIDASEMLYGTLYYDEKQNMQFKPQFIHAINSLLKYKTINESLHNELHEIRMYRNSVVHSTDYVKISKLICKRILDIEELVKQSSEAQKQALQPIAEALSKI